MVAVAADFNLNEVINYIQTLRMRYVAQVVMDDRTRVSRNFYLAEMEEDVCISALLFFRDI